MAGPKFIDGETIFIDWDAKWINRVETALGVIYKFKFRPKAPVFKFGVISKRRD